MEDQMKEQDMASKIKNSILIIYGSGQGSDGNFHPKSSSPDSEVEISYLSPERFWMSGAC